MHTCIYTLQSSCSELISSKNNLWKEEKNKIGCYIAIALLFIHYIYNTMHTEENITCRSAVERLHIL